MLISEILDDFENKRYKEALRGALISAQGMDTIAADLEEALGKLPDIVDKALGKLPDEAFARACWRALNRCGYNLPPFTKPTGLEMSAVVLLAHARFPPQDAQLSRLFPGAPCVTDAMWAARARPFGLSAKAISGAERR